MAFDSGVTDPGVGGLTLAVNTFTDTDAENRTLPLSGLAYGVMDAIPTIVSASNGLPVAQQGTWTVQPGNTANTTAWLVTGTGGTFPVTDSGGSLTVDAPVGTPVFVRLSDGSAAISTLPVSLASVPSHAVTNAGTFVVQVDGSALTALQLVDDVVFADDAAFTLATSKVAMAGAIRDDALAALSAAESDAVPLRVDANGALWVAISGSMTIGTHDVTNAGTFAVQAAQSGTWTVTGAGGTFPVTDSGGSLTVDAPVGTPVFVRLSDGSSAITTLPVSLATVPSHAVTNAGTFAVQVNGDALTSLQLLDDVIFVDDAAFTPATSKVAAVGMQADETATDSVDEGDIGCPRITLDRKQIVTPQPHTSGGLTPASFLSDGSTKAGVVKNAAGQLYGISTGNVNAAACYVRLYNMTTNPATSDTPVYRFMIPGNTAGSGREKNWPLGLAFSTGIAYRITTGAADNNDTATASAEVTANWDYK